LYDERLVCDVPDRRGERVLELLVESELALPPTPIYENLRMDGATFSKRTVHRKLKRLQDADLVERVVPEKGYYRATDAGHEYVDGDEA
jgi:Fe2+ or Zn2+ uptake regulation protein